MMIKGYSTREVSIYDLRPGDKIRVTFGTLGSQAATVTDGVRMGKRGLYIKATKVAAATGRVSKPRQVYISEIVGKVIG